LKLLKQHQIIEYIPQKEAPQIYFNLNRADASGLAINHAEYFKRKQQFTIRVKAMLQYLAEEKQCRSKIISRYFDAEEAKECGCCDCCLAKKNIVLTEEEFNNIHQKIYSLIPVDGINTKELLPYFKTIKKEKFWKVIQALQDERKIEINQLGVIKMCSK
jgi:ATP-dependent DNA helicase RecQ